MEVNEMPLGGLWVVTIFMVIIASWILYKYLAPKGFKEWRNAGLIQAFIIALYAERNLKNLLNTIFINRGWHAKADPAQPNKIPNALCENTEIS